MSMDTDDSAPAFGSRAGLRLDQLPPEVLFRVLNHCDREALSSVSRLSPHYNQLVVTFCTMFHTFPINALPNELVLSIFSFLDRQNLGRIAQVCRRFRDLSYADCLWKPAAHDCLVTSGGHESALKPLSTRDRVRVSRNWSLARYAETRLIVQSTRYMPRLQLERETLWVSWGNRIWAHPRGVDAGGTAAIDRRTNRVLKGHTDDVSRFVVKDGLVVSGGRDRAFVGWSAETGEFLFAKRFCHRGEVSAVDFVASKQVVVTGSRDWTVKIWSLSQEDNKEQSSFPALAETVNLRDRIWSVSACPSGRKLAVGSAGLAGVPALHVLDLDAVAHGHGQEAVLQPLGANLKRGAGMLDLTWQTEHTLMSCGYDSCVRMWDTRMGNCVRTWEDPFNEVIYCMSTDKHNTLMCGTARHGLVRLWDMRQTSTSVQQYYVKHANHGQSSPAYSIAFDQVNLYVAQDQCLTHLSFAGNDHGAYFRNGSWAKQQQQKQQQRHQNRHSHRNNNNNRLKY